MNVKEIYQTCKRHYEDGNVNWPMTIYIGIVHIAALVGAFMIPYCNKRTLLLAFILYPLRYFQNNLIVI